MIFLATRRSLGAIREARSPNVEAPALTRRRSSPPHCFGGVVPIVNCQGAHPAAATFRLIVSGSPPNQRVKRPAPPLLR